MALPGVWERSPRLERDGRAPLEAERLARLVGCSGLAVEEGGEGYGLLDELGVLFRPLVAADAEVVLEADAHVAAEH